MKTSPKFLNLFMVFSGLSIGSGNVYEGTVGQTVEIRCLFPDGQHYTSKYFCRHPCSSANVLIQTEKIDQVVSAGRYSMMYTVNSNTLTVTIKQLTLQDSGVYYCGLNQWFRDTLIKVKLSVHPAPVIPLNTTAAAFSSTPKYTESTWITTHKSADSSNSPPKVHTSNFTVKVDNLETTSAVDVSVEVAGVLLLLVFWFLVASVILFKRRSHSNSKSVSPSFPDNPVPNSPDINQTVGEIYHLYDELLTDHCVVGCPVEANASITYSTAENCGLAPQDDVDTFYSLITSTNVK